MKLLLVVLCCSRLEAHFVQKPVCPPSPADCSYKEDVGEHSYAYQVRGMRLVIYIKSQTDINYYCFNPNLTIDDPSMPKLRRSATYTRVKVDSCGLPQGSYTRALTALNVTSFHHLTLYFTTCNNNMAPSTQHFERNDTFLSLKIECKTSYNYLDLSFVQDLPGLMNLILENVISAPMQADNTLLLISISKGSPRQNDQPWGGCNELKYLSIVDWKINFLPDRWLAECKKLMRVELRQLTNLYWLPSHMFGSPSLSTVVVKDCHVTSLPDDFAAGANLTTLDVSNNQIEQLHHLFESEQMRSLQKLNLSGNLIMAMWLNALFLLKSLRVLKVDGVGMAYECPENWGNTDVSPWPYLPSLTELSLRQTDVPRICTEWGAAMPSLTLLNLTLTDITTLKYDDIEFLRTKYWEVDLRENNGIVITYSKEDFERVNNDQNSTHRVTRWARWTSIWLDSPYTCDCRWYWFAMTLREYPDYIQLPGFECVLPDTDVAVPIHFLSYEDLVCEVECAVGCKCYEYYDGYARLTCDGAGLDAVPRLRNVKHVSMVNNHIETLTEHDFPDTLETMDLSYNQLSIIDPGVLQKMFGSGTVQYNLTGNLIPCSCNNSAFIIALQHNKHQVNDYYNLTCIGGEMIDKVDIQAVCYEEHLPIYAGVAASFCFFLSLVLVLLYYRYRNEILVIMYSTGWFSCCLIEDELDKDKRFDVFISFAYGDASFVSETLLPRLEGPPNEFRVCVHYRDWVPGNWVPALIAHSVANSRRTIIVLSANFLASVWALLEFRTAHVQALKDGRVRLIVILLDDVTNDARIDDELKAYLTTNTFIRWGDALFWNKLLYALPHRKRTARPDDVNRADGEEVIRLMREGDPPIELRQDIPLEMLCIADTPDNAE